MPNPIDPREAAIDAAYETWMATQTAVAQKARAITAIRDACRAEVRQADETLAATLAQIDAEYGQPAALADTDPQGATAP